MLDCSARIVIATIAKQAEQACNATVHDAAMCMHAKDASSYKAVFSQQKVLTSQCERDNAVPQRTNLHKGRVACPRHFPA
jgi:hypothetical protein